MRKIGIVLLLVLVLILSGCDDSAPKDKVISYVKENHEILAEFPIDEIPRDFKEEKKFIKETLGRDTVVKSDHEYKEGVFYWNKGDDSETFYTERIMDNWFYYKMEWY